MHDESYEHACAEWLEGCLLWARGEHPDQAKHGDVAPRYFWDWDGASPDDRYYRPEWKDEERTHFQVYETVSEGTPVSPVFASKDEVSQWLRDQGYSETVAARFVEEEWVPSGLFVPGKGYYETFSSLEARP